YGHTLVHLATEKLCACLDDLAADEPDAINAAAACMAGALRVDREDCPGCTDRQAAMLTAYQLLESADLSFGFVQKPCESLAVGIRAGQRPAEPAKPIEFESEAFDIITLRTGYIQALANCATLLGAAQQADDGMVEGHLIYGDTLPNLGHIIGDMAIEIRK